ncbi:MAG: xanthine dehydrogenase family protein molybdopterin-binding subunit [Magnetospirillum sp.]|nr:xanthine dehydrogenase family protein molybdopterin-binding subunit [Magnetospirillum sp.]
MPKLVGQSVPRIEDPPLLRGTARFVDDVNLPGMLAIAFVRSPHSHASIGRIDTQAARALPGVRAVFTMEDLRHHLTADRLVVALPSAAYLLEVHRPILADREVAYVGEAVAVVVAESRNVAEDAAALVDIEYEPLAAVADCRAALRENAPRVHSAHPHNIAARFTLGFGDIDRAFEDAHHVFSESLWQHRGAAHPLECRGVVAIHDPQSDVLTVWSSTQTPHTALAQICDLLGRTENQVRVITPDVGGGFGPKLVFYPEDLIVPLVALRLAAPVKWIEDRQEHFIATTQERDQFWDVEIAVTRDARILGVRGRVVHDHGAYTARGLTVVQGAMSALPLAYDIPAYQIEGLAVLTNLVPVTPVRGAGQPQGVFAMERLLDRVANELGLDRMEVRRRNLVRREQMPFTRPFATRGGIPISLDSGDYPATMSAAAEKADWVGFKARQKLALQAGRHIGIGLANYVEGTGRGPYESVSVRIDRSGKVLVATGAVAMGQSTKTMLAQIVADELGGDMSNIIVTAGDTSAIAQGFGGFNSRQAVTAGSSALIAACKLRDRILDLTAKVLEVARSDLAIQGRTVRIVGTDRSLDFADLVKKVVGLPGYRMLDAHGPELAVTEHVQIDPMAYANGCAVVEVEVDPEIGRVDIRRVTFAHDCGRMINPKIVDGQVIGGIVHGIGNTLFEWMRYGADGQPLTTTLADYMLPTATEIPPIDLLHLSSPTPLNPLGIKGVGEAGVIPMSAAIVAAIEDALSPLGVHLSGSPITPNNLLAAIHGSAQNWDAEPATQ